MFRIADNQQQLAPLCRSEPPNPTTPTIAGNILSNHEGRLASASYVNKSGCNIKLTCSRNFKVVVASSMRLWSLSLSCSQAVVNVIGPPWKSILIAQGALAPSHARCSTCRSKRVHTPAHGPWLGSTVRYDCKGSTPVEPDYTRALRGPAIGSDVCLAAAIQNRSCVKYPNQLRPAWSLRPQSLQVLWQIIKSNPIKCALTSLLIWEACSCRIVQADQPLPHNMICCTPASPDKRH